MTIVRNEDSDTFSVRGSSGLRMGFILTPKPDFDGWFLVCLLACRHVFR